MKNYIYITFIGLFFISCKQKVKPILVEENSSVAEKIANAHGFENWKHVSEIAFTFAGKRHWVWKPKTNDVILITDTDTINYNRKSIDSLLLKTDKTFINDKFWLLIPFQLVWDTGATISEPTKQTAPISNILLNKITITYANKGGYTPGDAYDIYFDEHYLIKEWAFRKGNKPETGLVNTFENYTDFKGLKIALDHKKASGNWNLKFTNVKVNKDKEI